MEDEKEKENIDLINDFLNNGFVFKSINNPLEHYKKHHKIDLEKGNIFIKIDYDLNVSYNNRNSGFKKLDSTFLDNQKKSLIFFSNLKSNERKYYSMKMKKTLANHLFEIFNIYLFFERKNDHLDYMKRTEKAKFIFEREKYQNFKIK
jgi:uncharacterized phage-like protein YoqJ